MAQQHHPCPFEKIVFCGQDGATDVWPASYHSYELSGKKRKQVKNRIVANPVENDEKRKDFLISDLSIDGLESMEQHLWLAGSKRPPTQLHFQVAMGRQIIVDERMDHHLVWDNSGRIFLRPIPLFLLDHTVWNTSLACPGGCQCTTDNTSKAPPKCMQNCRRIARWFLYTYSCLVSSETDFFLANEHRLFPRGRNGEKMTWSTWKVVAREILANYTGDKSHERFQRGELRLSRLNIIHRLTRLPPFSPYIRTWRNYGSLFYGNVTWMVTATVFIALILTALQVGLATDRLHDSSRFQQASYGFTVFAIIGPIGVFGLVLLTALYNLVKDLPWLLSSQVRGGSDSATLPRHTQRNEA